MFVASFVVALGLMCQEKHIVGTIVTAESFEAWRAAFTKEMQAGRDAVVAERLAAKKGRLTGEHVGA